jgi:ABC-type transport system involved in multi-copper enzyme maturation permease subunit
MSNFVTILKMDLKRFLSPKRLLVIGLIIILTALSVATGIDNSKESLKRAEDFSKLQEGRTEKLKSHRQQYITGIKYYYGSSPLYRYLKPGGGVVEPVGQFRDAALLEIGKPKTIFNEGASIFRVSYILFTIGVLFALFIGAEVTWNKKYLLYMASVLGRRKAYWFTALSRVLVVSLILLIIFMTVPIVSFFNGFVFSLGDVGLMGAYFLTLLMAIVFSLIIGMVIGSACKKNTIYVPVLISWFIMALLVPGLMNKLGGKVTSGYEVDLKKSKILNEYNEKVYRDLGKLSAENKAEYERRAMRFLDNEYMQMEAIEDGLRNEVAAKVALTKKIALFTPMSFFIDTASEISSLGAGSYIEFYSWLQKQQREFCKNYIYSVFHGESKNPEPLPVSHLFYAQSRLPRLFGIGVPLNLLLLITALYVGFLAYNRGLFPSGAKGPATDQIDISFVPGSIWTYKVYQEEFIARLLNVLFGRIKGFKGSITLSDVNMVTREQKEFMVLPGPSDLPGNINTLTFLKEQQSLFNSLDEEFREAIAELDGSILHEDIKSLEPHEKALVSLSLARLKPCPVYVLIDMAKGSSEKFLDQLRREVDALRDRGALIIDIVSGDDNNTWHTGEDIICQVVLEDDKIIINEIK